MGSVLISFNWNFHRDTLSAELGQAMSRGNPRTMGKKKTRVLALTVVFVLAHLCFRSYLSAAQGPDAGVNHGKGEPTLTRVRIQVRGLVSPRAAQNIFIRLDKQKGVRAFKCDLGANIITVDFQPYQQVSKADAERVIRSAGWTPGTIEIERVSVRKALSDEAGRYWYVLPQLEGASGLKRWLVINFGLWTIYKDLNVDVPDSNSGAPVQGANKAHD
jgi:hypothetical protein